MNRSIIRYRHFKTIANFRFYSAIDVEQGRTIANANDKDNMGMIQNRVEDMNRFINATNQVSEKIGEGVLQKKWDKKEDFDYINTAPNN